MMNAATAPNRFERAIARPDWVRACLSFVLLSGSFAAVFHGSVATMSMIWLSSSAYHHGIVVAPLSTWLIFSRKDWRTASPASDYLGVAVLAAASFGQLISQASGIDLIGHASFVAAIIGAAIAAFGRELAARWAFPLAFLFFMVPFGEEATPVLQGWASAAIAAALNFSGVETARDGFMLTTSAGRFEIANSCAGLRFLLVAAMISSLISHLAFRDWRKGAACIALALSAALVANWLRAYLIVFVATVTDRRLGVGPEHVMLGWVFYSGFVIGLVALAKLYADKGEHSSAKAHFAAAPRRPATTATPATLSGLFVMSAFAMYDAAVLSSNGIKTGSGAAPSFHADGFEVTGAAPEWAAHAPNADSLSTSEFRSANAVVMVTLANFTRDRRNSEIVGADTRAADGLVWRRIAMSTGEVTFNHAVHRVSIEKLEDPFGRKIEVVTLYWLGNKIHGSPAALKLDIAARKLTGRPTEGGVIFAAANIIEEANAMFAIREFLRAVDPFAASNAAASNHS